MENECKQCGEACLCLRENNTCFLCLFEMRFECLTNVEHRLSLKQNLEVPAPRQSTQTVQNQSQIYILHWKINYHRDHHRRE